jgi:muconate cycloisomerase
VAAARSARSPLRLASETVAMAETLLVRLVDADGLEGWGEASAAPTMTGETLAGMAEAARRYLLPALLKAPVATEADLAIRLARAIRGNSGAKAAVEIAALDLLARRAALPLATLLGGAVRHEVPAIAMIGGGTPGEVERAAGMAAAQGFRHVKLKVGLDPDPRRDVAMVRAACAAIGQDARLSVDANMAWTEAQALAFVRALPAGALEYLEQPLRDDDLPGMARVAASAPFPLCFDEGLHGPGDITAHAAAMAAGGVGLKAIKLGGLRATLAAAALARAHGMAITLACKIAETSVGAAAAAHLAASLPGLDWGLSVTHNFLADDVTGAPLLIERGMVLLPTGTGHGIAPDPTRLARLRAR